MLYVVEMNFTQPSRQAAWDAWYTQHLHVLLSVPGFHTAQRFVCLTPWAAPYLAIYTVESPTVFESAAYRTRGGRESAGDWQPLMVNWDRNVFAGIERAPALAAGQTLLLTDDEPAAVAGAGVTFQWLHVAGLDRTVNRRGLAVLDEPQAGRLADLGAGRIRAYRPIMQQLRTGGERQPAGVEPRP